MNTLHIEHFSGLITHSFTIQLLSLYYVGLCDCLYILLNEKYNKTYKIEKVTPTNNGQLRLTSARSWRLTVLYQTAAIFFICVQHLPHEKYNIWVTEAINPVILRKSHRRMQWRSRWFVTIYSNATIRLLQPNTMTK